MLRRSGLRRGLLLAGLILGSAACDNESPTLSSDPLFPGGAPPVTREVVLPVGSRFGLLGNYTGYTNPNSAQVGFRLVANKFGGELDANTLLRTASAFPSVLRYTQDNAQRTDTLYRAVSGSLVLRIDSLGSSAGPVRLRVFRLAQNWDPATVTWTNAVDSAGVREPWATPGGTRAALVGDTVYNVAAAGDSVLVPLDSAALAALRDSSGFGITITSATPGTRVLLSAAPLIRAGLRPASPVRDTVIQTDLSLAGQANTFIFNPEPPQPSGVVVAGGIRSARSLFTLTLPDSVPGCATGTCANVPLRDVRLNRVSLVLRRANVVPAAFAIQDTAILSLFTVTDPSLGRRAPLGASVLDANPAVFVISSNFTVAQSAAVVAPGDTTAELSLTGYATRVAAGDTVPTTFALLGGPGVGVGAQRLFDAFGLLAFRPEPRLRIVYTLPVRTELP